MKHLTYWPPGVCVHSRRMVLVLREHTLLQTWIGLCLPKQTDRVQSLYCVFERRIFTLCLDWWIGNADTHTHAQRPALLGTATWGWWWNSGAWKEAKVCVWVGGGARKKEKCLLNDITIVSWSRTMALCKTANNERGRNPLSYRGLAACSPLP